MKKLLSEAFKKLKQWIEKQNGDISYIENTEKFTKAKYIIPVLAKESGYIKELNAQEIGKACVKLGAGRIRKEDEIDYSVGVTLEKKTADKVEKDEVLAYIHSNNETLGKEIANEVSNIYKICNGNIEKKKNILKIV